MYDYANFIWTCLFFNTKKCVLITDTMLDIECTVSTIQITSYHAGQQTGKITTWL
jgi:hypothetical protein